MRRKNSTHLSVESLEDRCTPSITTISPGVVGSVGPSGILLVKATNTAGALTMTVNNNGGGSWTVTDTGGSATFSGVTRGVSLDLVQDSYTENVTVNLNNQTSPALTNLLISLGNDNATGTTSANSVLVQGGTTSGSALSQSPGTAPPPALGINGGTGRDNITVANVSVYGNFKVNTYGGGDSVTLTNDTVNDIVSQTSNVVQTGNFAITLGGNGTLNVNQSGPVVTGTGVAIAEGAGDGSTASSVFEIQGTPTTSLSAAQSALDATPSNAKVQDFNLS